MAQNPLLYSVQINEKPHRSNKYIEERKKNEKSLQVSTDKVEAPKWLSTLAKRIFNQVSKELLSVNLATNVDVNALAVYADTVAKYQEFETDMKRLSTLLDKANDINDVTERVTALTEINKMIVSFSSQKLKLADNIRKYSVEFGLTAQSRARLGIPRDKKKKSEEEELFDV